VYTESSKSERGLQLKLGIPYFCDWKPGRFRTTSRDKCGSYRTWSM